MQGLGHAAGGDVKCLGDLLIGKVLEITKAEDLAFALSIDGAEAGVEWTQEQPNTLSVRRRAGSWEALPKDPTLLADCERHAIKPRIYIPEEPDKPNEWSFLIHRDDWQDGMHSVDFDGLNCLGIWAGD